jgi:hypothetical protein
MKVPFVEGYIAADAAITKTVIQNAACRYGLFIFGNMVVPPEEQRHSAANETEGQMKSFQEMVERIASALRAFFQRRYVRALEEEAARLRAENRALLNSLLGTAGIAPLESARPPGPLTTSVRRRSWPQIARSMESNAAAKRSFPDREMNPTRKAEHGN